MTTDKPLPPCLLLPDDNANGPVNMARDEALLDLVAADPSTAVLRTYGWSEPTLSLGYFQSIDEARSDPRWRDVPIVRRPTGGGAIWHDRELTYALAIPRSHPLSRQSGDLYRGVHDVIAALLRDLGAEVQRRGPVAPPLDGNRPFLCFRDRDADDLVIGPVKILGSSQRRRAGAILQHGSLLLDGSPRTPELPGVANLAELPDNIVLWSDLVRAQLPVALGFRSVEVAPPAAWLARADELEKSVYRRASWTSRR